MRLPLQSPENAADWLRERVTGTLRADSRQVGVGDGFIAWPGAASDGRKFVRPSLAACAAACLVEHEGAEPYGFAGDDRIASYAGLKAATGPIAAAFFGKPSEALQVVAVTGTNGKTSTAWWLAQALSKLGRRCGVVGTLGVGEPGAMVPTGLTTPDPVLLQQQLRRFVDEGFAACVMEASSIGIAEKRLDAVAVQVAMLTNFTQDHLDYHASMEAYWQAKRELFDWPGLKAAVINVDDAHGDQLAQSLAGRAMDLWTVSVTGPARLQARAVSYASGAMHFDVVEGGNSCSLTAPLVGQYNVSNLLGVIAALRVLGFSLADAARSCEGLTPVPGRTESIVQEGRPLVVVDYAHTPDALEKVLTALRPSADSRGGALWCVFGCGGDRDPGKRPLMAAAAGAHADRVVVTSDNPRTEDAAAIVDQILPGFTAATRGHLEVQIDRDLAIRHAIQRAQTADVVLIAGKGHEDYQDIQGVKHPFSDRAHAENALAAWSAQQVTASVHGDAA
ncbi:MAG: UDP-N-acetylmuramoyl-L-alanyl-D-glutamate--2,6-diaminopimelate ligase [Comamonadaceae bacterium]|nr:MAG: UDP-N-acetylmuramoyl-L-alanyl-D-glutamate--2,6-diaminopimelate ligase [Comamonadaceae bacterium]